MTEEYKGYKISVTQDDTPCAESPRGWENICYMHVLSPPRGCMWGDVLEPSFLAKIKKDAVLDIPLYALDHSVQRISTKSFNDPWDSWMCGHAYVTEKKLIEWFGETKVKDCFDECLESARKQVENEVLFYDKYLNSEFYYYDVEDPDGNLVDAEGGYETEESALHAAKLVVDFDLAENSPLFVAAGIDPWTFEKLEK